MAESLIRLVETEAFTVLQQKLLKWKNDYENNAADENLARACEIVELNARMQGQLFKLLSLCASEGSLYGTGAAGIKSRLLPLLGRGFFASGLSTDASLSAIADAAGKERETAGLKQTYESSLKELEDELNKFRVENEDMRAELEDTKQELEKQGRVSASEKMFSDAELSNIRLRLTSAEEERRRLQSRADLVEDYDRQVHRLREEITELHAKRDLVFGPPPCYYPDEVSFYSPLEGSQLARSVSRHLAFHGQPSVSPLSPSDPLQKSRRQALIGRYHDLAAVPRLDAMHALRRCYDDHENNQRIVYTAVQESFALTKLAFRQFKARVRSHVLLSPIGPHSLEEAVQDYINCYHQPAEALQGLVQDVIRALSRNYRLHLPSGIGYEVIAPFIRDVCRVAWEMAALATPPEVVRGREGEVFDEQRYRRSYDSEFEAPLVSHYIWPALLLDGQVVVKGEACTGKGAGYVKRTRSASRTESWSKPLDRGPQQEPASGTTKDDRSLRTKAKTASTVSPYDYD